MTGSATDHRAFRHRTRWATLALALTLLACLPAGAAASEHPDPGRTTEGTVNSNGTEYPYLLYTPASYRPGRSVPLLVMLHGCQTTAQQELELTRFNALAERERFVVLYAEADAIGRGQPGPLRDCWKFVHPTSYWRGYGDVAGIAEMTRAVMAKRAIDPERVYLVGVSAGGLMASAQVAAYPDLYAAVGLVASAGYLDGFCFTTGVGIPVELSAQLAYDQMGPRARIVPRIAIGSDADLAFPATCTNKALEQGLRTNNLVLGGSQEGPIDLVPAVVREKRKRDGHAYTVSRYRDPAGCLIGERWIIHGMPHAWPGGTSDEKYAGYTDTRAPSGANGTWRFLRRYRRSETGMPCAEARCPASAVTLTLPRGPRVLSVRARVDGRRVRVTIRGRRVRFTIPSGRKATVRIVLRVRRQGRSHAQVVRRTLARC